MIIRNIFKCLILGTLISFHSRSQGQNLQSYRDQFGDAYVTWEAQAGYFYKLQTSSDLKVWTTDSEWTGFDHTISVLVQEAPGGGGAATLPGLPQETFSITTFAGGESLINWAGEAGLTYQLYQAETYFALDDPPLLTTEVTNPSGNYQLMRVAPMKDDTEAARSLRQDS